MQIKPLSDTDFKGLYATPTTLKKIGCTKEMLLNNPSINDCAKKFDVLVTAGKSKYVVSRHDGFTKDKILPAAYLSGVLLAAPNFVSWLASLGITNPETIAGISVGALALAGMSIIKLVTQRLNEINILGASKVEQSGSPNINSAYYNEFSSRGKKTPVYAAKINSNGIIGKVPDMASDIYDDQYRLFTISVLKKVNIENMKTPQTYLAELEKIQATANELSICDVFRFPINKGGDTLLTRFFDLAIPDKTDEDGMDAYYKIIKQIAITSKDNFNQTDSNGITNLEKIMRTENDFVFPFIKGCKFSYSPYLKDAYDNIKNDAFKNQLQITADFNFDLLMKKEGKA